MSPLDLASSALPKFDLKLTIEAAIQNGFEGVQLYLNEACLNEKYITDLVELIESSALANIVIHLPDIEKLESEPRYIDVAHDLCSAIGKGVRVLVLVHYVEDLEASTIKNISDGIEQPVGIENSKTGGFYPESIILPFQLSRVLGSFFVYDIGRMFYASSEEETERIAAFTVQTIRDLDPTKDIIHLTGKTSWTKRFRECSCAYGIEEDITPEIVKEAVREFESSGGVIVFEHEDLQQALDSRRAFDSTDQY